MRYIRGVLGLLVITGSVGALALAALAAPAGVTLLWTMEDPQEIAGISNDNTGARFELSSDVAADGSRSLKVIPSGSAIETKLAIPLEGHRTAAWATGGEVVLHVYIPEGTRLMPTMFFLGMADLTGGWNWVGGVFSDTKAKAGWNEVRYPLGGAMRQVDPSRRYMIYLAFAGFDAKGQKVPLTEPFYLDAMGVTTRLSRSELMNRASPGARQEVATLLQLSDDALLTVIQRKAFAYFWEQANPITGLVRDRSRDDAPASIAAVGFGLSALPVGIERGWITRDEGYHRALTTLRTFAEGGVEGKNGFFYHFVDMSTGRRSPGSELSSIDTALFLAGALTVGKYFAGTEVESFASRLYEAADWQWMMNEGTTPSMGWTPEGGFIKARWNTFNEGLLLHILAIGSPTRPIPAAAWDEIHRPIQGDHIALPAEVLFVYQYPLVWLDLRHVEDAYANYFNNAAAATRHNRRFSLRQRDRYKTYEPDIWGLSASDGPAGYRAYGASENNHDGTIAPYASIASIPFTPELSLKAIRTMLERYGPLIWGKYGFVSAFNGDEDWYSTEFIGIDQGDLLLMIENYRTGLIWRYFMQNEPVREALKKVGFVERSSDYAITPAYQAKFRQMQMGVEQRQAVAVRRSVPVEVDAELAEWANVPFNVVDETMNVPDPGLEKVDRARQVLHGRFAAQWDEQFLYLAAEVTDPVVVSNIAPDDRKAFYRTDSVEFYIDPSRAGSAAGIMKLAILPFDTAGHVQAVRHEDARPGPIDQTAPGVLVASRRTADGYALEVALPLEHLGIEGKPGVSVGFSFTIHNTSNRNAGTGEYVRTNMLAWNNVPAVWANPDLWGTLTLE
ncbi:MAG: glucoamylase family protein [Bacillota bacterium]